MNSVQNKNLKIFLGPCWYGRIAITLGSALREKGLRVTVAVRDGALSRYPDADYDVIMKFQGLKTWQKIIKVLRYFWRFIHHDAFIFLYGDTLLPYNLDLPILKLLRKKVIMWFIGSDIRHYELFEAAAKKAGVKYYFGMYDDREKLSNLKAKQRMIKRVERYADYILSFPDMSQLLTRRYYYLSVPLDIQNIRYNNIPNPRPIVVHAPSDAVKKGTSYVVKAVEQLKKEGYDFEFHLFQNMPNKVVRETLSKADIALDQFFGHAVGVFGVEAMAAGCAVLGGNIPEFSHRPGVPVIHTDPDNIYQNLKLLLENPKLRQELGEKGRKYVEKYHDSRRVAADILELLSGNTENLISYDPNS